MKETTILNLINKIAIGIAPKEVYFQDVCFTYRKDLMFPFNYLKKGTNEDGFIVYDALFTRGITLDTKVSYREEILDKVEKEYLSNIIKPFRKRIKWIVKTSYKYGTYIQITYRESDFNQKIVFPVLSNENMYKGMELDQEYTLKELGL